MTIPRNSFVLAAFALEPDQLSPTLLADAALVPFAGFNCCKNGLAIKTTYAILMGGTFRELLEDYDAPSDPFHTFLRAKG